MYLLKRVLINYHNLYQYSSSTSMQNQFITGLKLKNSLTNNLVYFNLLFNKISSNYLFHVMVKQ